MGLVSYSECVATSNCSLGVGVDFYWYGKGPVALPGRDGIAAAVDALMAAVDSPARRWNMYNKAFTRREFTKRLEAASRGELVPVDQVKPVEDPDAEWLFEIRWADLALQEQRQGEALSRHITIEARLYHAEPLSLGVVAIGLHAHEKAIVEDDPKATRQAQDLEIHEAIVRYNDGLASRWGISTG